MWRAAVAVYGVLAGYCAALAWFMGVEVRSPEFPRVVALAFAATGLFVWLLLRPLGPSLARVGFGRRRRVSALATLGALGSLWLMRGVLGGRPSFWPAFLWLLVMTAAYAIVHLAEQRRATPA